VIKVTVELYPSDTSKPTRVLGTAIIYNDGKGTATRGNYEVILYRSASRPIWKQFQVTNFPRKSKHVWYLLKRVLESLN